MRVMTEYDYHYVIAGPPQPQLRHRARLVVYKDKRKKSFISMYDDPKSAREKKHIAMLIKKSAPEILLDCPLRVDLIFHMPRPLAHYGTGSNRFKLKPSSPKLHTKKPDKDNLSKLLMDALTGVVWRDDSIICDGRIIKRYTERPRTEIFIKLLEEAKEKELW